LNIAQREGYTKYSKVKLALLVYGKSLTGYSISFNCTTDKPNTHVTSCLKKNATDASRILFLGINFTNKPIVIIHSMAISA